MRTWQRVALITFAAIAAIAGGAYYWLFYESPAPEGHFDIDMSEVRRLAGSIPGSKPSEIHVEHVADFKAPAAAMVAGDGWESAVMHALSYQLIYPDRTIILDTAMNADQAKAMGSQVNGFYQDAYDRMIKDMSSASLILLTHEHPDHIGGLAAHPELARLLKTSARITREQAGNTEHMLPARFPDNALAGYQPLSYEHYFAAAPGVVLIKSPGHALGSQMIFVQQQDGKEFLFLGDVAWSMRNVTLVRERPRFITNMLAEDRAAVMRQLAALHSLTETEPKVKLVPGHDPDVIAELIKGGLMHDKFQ
jgi:glyoxylase-like metal-dependent hydrolase (beta-lactamase superfamily II)